MVSYVQVKFSGTLQNRNKHAVLLITPVFPQSLHHEKTVKSGDFLRKILFFCSRIMQCFCVTIGSARTRLLGTEMCFKKYKISPSDVKNRR